MDSGKGTTAAQDTLAAPDCVELFGLPVCAAPRQRVVDWLLARLEAGMPTQVVTPNAEIVLLAHGRPEVRRTLLRADLFIPDGIGLVRAARILKGVVLERYAGIDLAQDLLAALALRGDSAYLLGAAPGVAESAAARLTERYPGLKIAGFRDGFFGASEAQSIAEGIGAAKAALLLVGMGCPRQEGFIAEYRSTLGAPLMLGIGGALEVWAGARRRAPRWIQALHLEWLFRALQDPGRIGRTFRLFSFFGLVYAEKRRLAAAEAGQGRGGAA